jgi:hypothetical protein
MPGLSLPKVVDAAFIADTLTLEAETFRGLLRTGCLTPSDASRFTEELGRFCLEAAAAVRSGASPDSANGSETLPPRHDEWLGRLPAEALFWD